MDKLKFNSLGIKHTSTIFHAVFQSLNGVFNIHQGNMESMDVFTNGGHIEYKQYGTVYLFSLKVFYNPNSISNIFSLVDVTSQFRVTMDINNKPAMFIHTGSDSVLKFCQCRKGLYDFHTSDPNILNPFLITYSLLSTIQEQNKFFHKS